MKPIRLMMRAFGPYKDEQVIDFRDLQEHRLFAISGKTGAGKTTIFDGIAFALYGNGSGSDREDTKGLRSQFADEKVHTAVELLFESKGKTYSIFRQLAHKKKGNKSETGDKITLFEINERGQEIPACKPKLSDVRLKIEEIIGLTYDQFNQIVMLPQGEFRKLLTSETKNKEKILRKVFKTGRYEQIAQKLESKKRAAEDEANIARKMRDQYIDQIAGALPVRDSLLFIRLAEHSNIFQIVEALVAEQLYYEQKVKQDEKAYQQACKTYEQHYEQLIVAKQQNEQLIQLEKKRQQFAELQLQKPAIDLLKQELTQAKNALKVKPYYEALQATKKEGISVKNELEQTKPQLAEVIVKLDVAKESYAQQQQTEPVRQQLANEMNELEKIKPLYEELEQLKHQLPILAQRVSQAQNELDRMTLETADLKQQLLVKQQEIERLDVEVASLPAIMQEQQQIKDILKALQQWQEVTTKLTDAQLCVQQAILQEQQQRALFDEQQKKWMNHRAYELAVQLQPGEACPVCGSLEHPSLQLQTEQADSALLQAAQQSLDESRHHLAAAQAQQQVLSNQQQQIAVDLATFNVDAEQLELYEQQFQLLNETVKDLHDKSTHLLALKQQHRKYQAAVEDNEQQFERLRGQLTEAQTLFLQKQTLFDSKKQSVPSELQTLTQVNALLQQQDSKLTELKQALEQAEKIYQRCQLQEAKLTQTVAHLTEQLQQLQQKWKLQQAELEQAVEVNGFTELNQFLQSIREEASISHMQQRYDMFTQQFITLQQMIEEQQQLLAGKETIDLTALEQQLVAFKQQVDAALVVVNTTHTCVSNCQQYGEKLQQVANEIDRLEKYSGEVVQLYKVLVGQNDELISFERFIQIGYLEQITEAANLRLYHLSNGQFTLRCSDRKEGNRRQSGLSLDVYDSYTGLPRDVKSLSGGEKFNASLCLALGLADVIQSFQGNVRIDTMFIDEGFGSLDEESLVKAIDILIELQKSGRIVGVISHVEELKEAMPAIIHIEKLTTGYSRAEIIVK